MLSKNLLPNIVYITKSISSYLRGSSDKASLKKPERCIIEQSLNFDRLTEQNDCDEHGQPIKSEVMKYLTDKYRRKRDTLLFTKIIKADFDQTFLFINDAKGGRRWINLCI